MDSFAGICDDVLAAPVEIGRRELALQPWEVNPYRLISWLEMLQFSARGFFWCGRGLRALRMDCFIGSIYLPGDQPIFALARDLDDRAKTRATNDLKPIASQFHELGLEITAATVKEVIDELEQSSTRHNFQWLADQLITVEKLAEKELDGKDFFYVPRERAKFFPRVDNQHIFGNAVGEAFPSATYDIAESGFCLALARGTACVFHLMRVLEIGLAVLGAKFGVSLAHTNWAPAIGQIESKIREMHKEPDWKALPDCKEQQEFYAQAASHFGVLKDAWRNYTAHARGKYTEQEAEEILINVRSFMQKLATRLSELRRFT